MPPAVGAVNDIEKTKESVMDELKILSEEYKDAFISHFMCKWGASREVAELEYYV